MILKNAENQEIIVQPIYLSCWINEILWEQLQTPPCQK